MKNDDDAESVYGVCSVLAQNSSIGFISDFILC